MTRDLLQRNARDEIYDQAKLLIDSALAVREYTSRNIAPLLETQIRYEFRPEMVSAFSANEVLRSLRDANPEYKKVGRAQKLIVAGCLVERYRGDIRAEMPEVDALIGTNELDNIVALCEGLEPGTSPIEP